MPHKKEQQESNNPSPSSSSKYKLDLVLDNSPIVLFYKDRTSKFEYYKGKGIDTCLNRHDPKNLFELVKVLPVALSMKDLEEKDEVKEVIKVGESGEFLLSYTVVRNESSEVQGISGYFIDNSKITEKANHETDMTGVNSVWGSDYAEIRSEFMQSHKQSLISSFQQTLESKIAIKMSKLMIQS